MADISTDFAVSLLPLLFFCNLSQLTCSCILLSSPFKELRRDRDFQRRCQRRGHDRLPVPSRQRRSRTRRPVRYPEQLAHHGCRTARGLCSRSGVLLFLFTLKLTYFLSSLPQILFSALAGGTNIAIKVAIQHPYSRGTVMINSTKFVSSVSFLTFSLLPFQLDS